MSEEHLENEEQDQEEQVSLKAFFLQAVLWLPLSFFFWFLWSGVLTIPVLLLSDWVLSQVLGDFLREVYRQQYLLMIEIYFTPPEGTRLQLNPMIYGYGLPVLAGLAISTPNRIRIRVLQLLIGWILISLIQTWGIVFETLHQLEVWTGSEGQEVARAVGVPAEVTAMGYQFGYLILPAVTPVATWILLNRRFFERIVDLRRSEIGGSGF